MILILARKGREIIHGDNLHNMASCYHSTLFPYHKQSHADHILKCFHLSTTFFFFFFRQSYTYFFAPQPCRLRSCPGHALATHYQMKTVPCLPLALVPTLLYTTSSFILKVIISYNKKLIYYYIFISIYYYNWLNFSSPSLSPPL